MESRAVTPGSFIICTAQTGIIIFLPLCLLIIYHIINPYYEVYLVVPDCFGISDVFRTEPLPGQYLCFPGQYKKDLFAIIKKDTGFVRFYAPDIHYKVTATTELLDNQSLFAMATSDGRTHQARKIAKFTFILNGKSYQLYAYQLAFLLQSKDHKDDFFIPFFDEGSGEVTYGGGRYIDLTLGEIHNNKLVIDFNKAYNPYCAFVSGYSCPIPPKENTLSIKIEAGEKNFAKSH